MADLVESAERRDPVQDLTGDERKRKRLLPLRPGAVQEVVISTFVTNYRQQSVATVRANRLSGFR